MIAFTLAMMLASAQAQPSPGPSPTPTVVVGIVPDPCAQAPSLALDWGQICHFAAANAALAPATPQRVVFFGDSITELWLARDPTLFAGDVLDRGISGQTTAQMLVRFREDVLDLHPAVVQIMGGTNDIAGNTGPTTLARVEGNIATMAQLARAAGISVILASIPPATRYFWRPSIDPAPSIAALNAWLQGCARDGGFLYADYYDALSDGSGDYKAGLSADGTHPSVAGFAVMRPIAEAAMARALAQRSAASSVPAAVCEPGA